MPVSYRIDKSKKIVFADATNELTSEDIRTYRRSVLDDPDFDPHFDHLFNFNGVTEVRMIGDEVRTLAEDTIFHKHARKAHVVPNEVMFGISRMFSLYLSSEPDELQVFRDVDEARRWLGLD